MGVDLDELDRKLIALLRSDSRKPAAALAQALGVSRGTIQNRIDKLLAAGVIQRFTIATRTDEDEGRVRAVMSIEIEGERSKKVLRQLRGFPEVVQVHTTNGRWDLITELDVATLAEFSRTLDAIRRIEGIAATETSILLAPQF
jgi:DNA-binding Lrp family transcriptional regulator